MKIQTTFAIGFVVLLAAGCSREKQARYEQTSAPTYGATPSSSSTAAATRSVTTPQGGFSESERALISQVQAELNKNTTLAAISPSIQITAQNGIVTLSGTVPSEQDKQMIESTVKNAGNVVSLNNQLQVSTTTSTTSGQSSAITPAPAPNQPLSPTASQPGAPSRVYEPAQPGQPQPSGATAPATQADSFSLNIKGMTEADKQLAQQIGQALKADTATASLISNMKINVNDSKATLKGTVSSDDEKKQVESAIQKIPGVTSVDNQLQVGASEQGENKPKQN